MFKWSKLSFGARLIVSFNVVSITFLCLGGVALTVFTNKLSESALTTKIDSVISIVENFSGGPIWNMEHTTLENASKKVLEDEDISGIVFYDVGGAELVKKLNEKSKGDVAEVSKDIVGGDENAKVGVVKLMYNKARLDREGRNTIVIIFSGIVFLQLLFSSFLFLIVRLQSRPLIGAMGSLENSSNVLDNDANKLSGSSNKLSESLNRQAASIEETSASLTEISGMLESNVSSANKMKDDSSNIKAECEDANETMNKLQESMDLISESNEKVEKLSEIIQDIKDKTEIMDEIVFQTKLLSFNASVEAERAGEHGRGFAVVAQEVGNLAGLSGKAAQEISVIVNDSMSEAHKISSENKDRVTSGIGLVHEASSALSKILESTDILDKESDAIMRSSTEQSNAVRQITDAMNDLDNVTQGLNSESQATRDISETVLKQTEELNSVVNSLNTVMNGDKKAV